MYYDGPIDEYEPKYVHIEDVPISGPDEYSQTQKRKAIFGGESAIELDLYDGSEIPSDEITNAHIEAILNYATHRLTHAAEEPSDVTLGDMLSGGGTITEYSSRYLETYNDIIDQLEESGAGGHGNFSIAVNTRLDNSDNDDQGM